MDIKRIFRWEAIDQEDFVFLNSPTPGGNPQLWSTHFTIPLDSESADRVQKIIIVGKVLKIVAKSILFSERRLSHKESSS